MPTECERTEASPAAAAAATTAQQPTSTAAAAEQEDVGDMERERERDEMTTSTGSASSGAANGHNGSASNGGKKSSITSPDPTAYVAKARVTRPTPPPPSYNPMQFVQIKPCNLYQTAQQQLKKAEEVKKIKEIKKEEPEDWQNNLDNWKSSRRKRVEHIIDRVVEVKKLELEEHDRSRRKSKTFSEMIEERGERGVRGGRAKLASLAVYNEDESNDLSDLGIGTSSASGKSSLSEDYDNNSVTSDNADLDRAIFDSQQQPGLGTREYISSPGYDTSSSTAPASSPDPCEYTYEGAIQDYKQRVSRATGGATTGFKDGPNGNGNGNANGTSNGNGGGGGSSGHSKEATPERAVTHDGYPTRRGSKIEERLVGFEVFSPNDSQDGLERSRVDLPKIDISKRKEIFESSASASHSNNEPKPPTTNGVPKVALRDRFKPAEAPSEAPAGARKEARRLSGDISSIKDRLQSLEQQNLVNSSGGAAKPPAALVDVPVPPLKERLSSLQSAVTKEEVRKSPVVLVDARQLEIMKDEEATAKLRRQQETPTSTVTTTTTMATTEVSSKETKNAAQPPKTAPEPEVDRDDSGIHTSEDLEEERLTELQAQEQKLNEAIAALVMEEQQLEQAANAVNQIEAEFAELSSSSLGSAGPSAAATTNEHPCEMEFSVSPTNNLFRSPTPTEMPSRSLDSGVGVGVGIGIGGGSPRASDNVVVEVAGAPVPVPAPVPAASPGLRRKPSNEMVHARNLLKMFKETFKNDIELDEEPEEPGSPPESAPETPTRASAPSGRVLPIPSRTFQSSLADATPTPTPTAKPSPPSSAQSPSLIPRSIGPAGKPPMSPKLPRGSGPAGPARPVPSPLGSPAPSRRPDGQFSINGRVEIFNSKNMQDPPKPASPTSPTASPKRSQLPQFVAAALGMGDNGGRLACPPESSATRTQAAGGPKTKPPPLPQPSTGGPPVSRCPGEGPPAAASPAPTEVVVCAPPVTIVNPEELPKPNTVRALTSCFNQDRGHPTPAPAPAPIPPKPLPRSRVSQTPPQSPQPAKRILAPRAEAGAGAEAEAEAEGGRKVEGGARADGGSSPQVDSRIAATASAEVPKTLSTMSTTSSSSASSDSASSCSTVVRPAASFETTALVHAPPCNARAYALASERAERPRASAPPTPAKVPPLLVCNPNESSLFKLAASTPTPSPTSPSRPSDNDIALCTDFFASAAPFAAKALAAPAPPARQQTVDEAPCDKLDVRRLPAQAHGQAPPTSCLDVSTSEAQPRPGPRRPDSKPNSKPNSPLMTARAAHSKALIETCEKIIAEERQARSQMSPGLPSPPTSPQTPTSQKSTPVLGRRSRIPKHMPCCIGGSDSLTTADWEDGRKPAPTVATPEAAAATAEAKRADDEALVIARLHVVETQIKVTTTTPPASPKPSPKASPTSAQAKKPKNIFDFLKSRFGHPEPEGEGDGEDTVAVPEGPEPVHTVKVDEIFKVDNSRFYVAAEEPTSATPPPLPLSPAPVNIEITKKITTDEILEEAGSELALSREINDMLDEELNKLQADPGQPAHP